MLTRTLELPLADHRPRRRAITVELILDDLGAERALHDLLAVARLFDGAARAHAADAARELPWTELSFVAIDVETTGFSPAADRIIEVAWVRFEKGREVERFASLVRAPIDVPEPVQALTGITPAMLSDKPRFAEVAAGVAAALASADFVVAYNARFDRGFLSAELARAGHALPGVPWVDPLAFVGDVDTEEPGGAKKKKSKKLGEVARRFDVEVTGAHRAENDARTTGKLLLKLAPRLPARTLNELLDTQGRWSRVPMPAEPPAPTGIGARLLSLFR